MEMMKIVGFFFYISAKNDENQFLIFVVENTCFFTLIGPELCVETVWKGCLCPSAELSAEFALDRLQKLEGQGAAESVI